MTFTHTLADPRVATTLSRMFTLADLDGSTQTRTRAQHPGRPEPKTPQELADATSELYMPISAEGGQLLYNLVRAVRPATVVEFGMSFGVSTLHLAAAVRDNGSGRVVTTELNKDKVTAARRTFSETGLDDVVTVVEGDALETLAGLDAPADFVLLDGWKDLCLPVLRLLEPHLAPGTLVVADDVNLSSLLPYLEYVRTPANGYHSVTFPVDDGMEISCRL
ncbi:O-methyltransferase [Streptomyces sp. NBC_00859]|uniref:O-methyltransferase n=1 Tax=Streptomyces sp. NBC_00859 TaxID=2903682 RepID=UPI00386DFFEF|nr:class I SAM-dependent methyltransferase [Streptomyces sp. NBC_00859]